MQFNFACYALCAVTIEDDLDTDLSEVSAQLLGFYSSVDDATNEQAHRTWLLRAGHKTQYGGPKWPWRAPEFKEPIYQLVPIQQMRFDDLSDAQEMIESAAVLQQRGCGV